MRDGLSRIRIVCLVEQGVRRNGSVVREDGPGRPRRGRLDKFVELLVSEGCDPWGPQHSSWRFSTPPIPSSAIQYDCPAAIAVDGMIGTSFHAPAVGEASLPEASSSPGCPLLSAYTPATRAFAFVFFAT